MQNEKVARSIPEENGTKVACPKCGKRETFSRTYRVADGATYTLSFFTCKHPQEMEPPEGDGSQARLEGGTPCD